MALEDAMFLGKVLKLALSDHQKQVQAERNTRLIWERAFKVFEQGRRKRAELIVNKGCRRIQLNAGGKNPPGFLRCWFTEKLVAFALNYLAPYQQSQIFQYKIEWDDCTSLAELEASQ